jgi:hypothetical protein
MKTNAAEQTQDAITTLRAMYRSVRDGQNLDTAAYVDALLDVAADGGDVPKIMGAFEALGYWTRLDIVGMTPGGADRVRAAKASRGWKGAIKVASHLGLSDVWAAAMTAHFGPVGTHESRRGADGVPTVETMAEFPRIGERMAEAARAFEVALDWYARVNEKNAHFGSQVVRYSAPFNLKAG